MDEKYKYYKQKEQEVDEFKFYDIHTTEHCCLCDDSANGILYTHHTDGGRLEKVSSYTLCMEHRLELEEAQYEWIQGRLGT